MSWFIIVLVVYLSYFCIILEVVEGSLSNSKEEVLPPKTDVEDNEETINNGNLPISENQPISFKGYTMVQTEEALASILQETYLRGDFVLLYASTNIEYDSYFDLYAGWLAELFRPDNFVVLDMVATREETSTEGQLAALEKYFRILAQEVRSNVLFLVITHSYVVLNYNILNQQLIFNGKKPLNIFILNHEQPWVSDNEKRRDNQFVANSDVLELYDSLGLVVRNYYYKPLLQKSHYFPVGPQKYGYIIGNKNHSVNKRYKKASERSHRCIFAGRFLYIEDSFLHAERWAMKNLIDNGEMQCTLLWLEELNRKYTHTILYDDYIDVTSDTVFVPCPAGNNPETFRHYEALELGCIPLIVKPHEGLALDLNFLMTWNSESDVDVDETKTNNNNNLTYPGPIFDSWREAETWMATIEQDPNDLDDLQLRIQKWYQQFKFFYKKKVDKMINNYMDIRRRDDSNRDTGYDRDIQAALARVVTLEGKVAGLQSNLQDLTNAHNELIKQLETLLNTSHDN
jgi:hypothetical protein